MKRTLSYLVIATFLFSCTDEQEKTEKNIAIINYYKRFTLSKELFSVDTIEYTYDYLNDTVILMKFFHRNKDEITTTIDCVNGNQDSCKLDSLPYQPYYLHFGKYCKPRFSAVGGHENDNEYYSYEYEKSYFIEDDSIKIITFNRDFDGVDGDVRMYFNDKVGYLVGYSTSWHGAEICNKLFDDKKNKLRKKILKKLLIDSNFFPYPKALHPPPPPPLPNG